MSTEEDTPIENDSREEITERDKNGIAAIKYLQGVAGIEETDETALKGWRGMSETEQNHTLEFCAAVIHAVDKLHADELCSLN